MCSAFCTSEITHLNHSLLSKWWLPVAGSLTMIDTETVDIGQIGF